MRLNDAEYYKFIEIYQNLTYYTGKKKDIFPATITFESFQHLSIQDKFTLRNILYDNVELLDEYMQEYADVLSEEEKSIIRDFKYFKRGRFYVMKYTKQHAHFLGDQYVYGVYALNDPFEEILGRALPTMVEAVLLPYNGKIIYDGILSSYPMIFGRGIKSSIKNDYSIAAGKYGIITELPEKLDQNKLEEDVEKELIILMKTKESRGLNSYRIEQLLKKHPELEAVYIREWGRVNARKKRKEIKQIGIKKRWFAMYNDTIIVSGKTEKEVKKAISELIPDKEKQNGIYYFKV